MTLPTRGGLAALLCAAMLPAMAAVGDGGSGVTLPVRYDWTLSLGDGKERRTYRVPGEMSRILALPAAERERALAEIRRIDANAVQVRAHSARFFLRYRSDKAPPRLIPDYRRTLAEVLVSVSAEEGASADPLRRHWPVFAALPAYTRIHLIVGPRAAQTVRQQLEQRGYAARVTLHSTEAWARAKHQLTATARPVRWARDLALIGDGAGRAAMLLPLAYAQIDDLVDNDLNYLEQQFGRVSTVVRLPAFVRGGNVQVAETNGKRYLLVGEDEFIHDREVFRHATQSVPGDAHLRQVLKLVSGADEVIVLPNSPTLFHIDMYLSALAPGVVAMLAPLEPQALKAAEVSVIGRAAERLRGLGFSVLAVPTTAERIARFQSPVNVVPYRDRDSGAARVLLPEFPDVMVRPGGGPARSLNAMVRDTYRSKGFDPVPVDDLFHERNGNTHCAVLGLS